MNKLFLFFLMLMGFFIQSCKKDDPGDTTIWGVVTDISTGNPLNSATVILFDSQGLYSSKTTGSDGRYSLVVAKDLNSYSDYLRTICEGYETIETSDIDIPRGETRQFDFTMHPVGGGGGGGSEFPITGSFHEAPSLFDYPYFELTNTSNSFVSNIIINLELVLGNTWSNVIALQPNQTYTIINYVGVIWYYGDMVKVTVNGTTETWIYP